MTDTELDDRRDRPAPPLPPPLPEPPTERSRSMMEPAGAAQKSPPLAAALSFILPGLGHLYAESRSRGTMLLASFGLSILLLASVSWPFVFLCIFLWFFGMFDAYREAQICNLDEDERASAVPRQDGGRVLFGGFLLIGGCLLLLDRLGLDVDRFLRDWWPALVVAAGLYFLVGAFRERTARLDRGRGDRDF